LRASVIAALEWSTEAESASTATLDEEFGKDVEAAIESHHEPLNPPLWD
jgi:hypothetical protein